MPLMACSNVNLIKKSRLGGYLNEITDVVSDAALYLPFAFVATFNGIQISSIIWLAIPPYCVSIGRKFLAFS